MLFPHKKNSILNWYGTYQTNPDKYSIFLHLQLIQNKWIGTDIATIHTGYRTDLKEHRIWIIKGKLVLLKTIFANAQQLATIIVPNTLWQKCFGQFHSRFTGSHMGEYKILYHVWLWSFWQASERTSSHGSKAALTAYHIIYWEILNKNFIFIGQ